MYDRNFAPDYMNPMGSYYSGGMHSYHNMPGQGAFRSQASAALGAPPKAPSMEPSGVQPSSFDQLSLLLQRFMAHKEESTPKTRSLPSPEHVYDPEEALVGDAGSNPLIHPENFQGEEGTDPTSDSGSGEDIEDEKEGDSATAEKPKETFVSFSLITST